MARRIIKKDDSDVLRAVKMTAMMGEVLGRTPKEKNDFKKRMMVAGLGKQGLSFPEDFDSLPEKERRKRLNKALSVI